MPMLPLFHMGRIWTSARSGCYGNLMTLIMATFMVVYLKLVNRKEAIQMNKNEEGITRICLRCGSVTWSNS